MFNIVIPANVITMMSVIIPLVMFDILEQFGIMEKIFPSSNEDADIHMQEYSQLRDLGYETFNIFMNLGTLAIFFALYILKLLMVGFLKPLSIMFPSLFS
jgi:hypothetical protein